MYNYIEDHMNELEEETFSYADHIDIHSLECRPNIDLLVNLAIEHGFKGILVLPHAIQALANEIKKHQGAKVNPIVLLEYPFGVNSLDIKNYSIISSKEKGAKEVEIVFPYHFLTDRNFNLIENEIRSINNTAVKNEIKLRYVFDLNSHFAIENTITRIGRIMSNIGMTICTSTGFFDKNINHSDNILKIRALKNKTDLKIKSYLGECDIDTMSLYSKSGIDYMGLNWQNAAKLLYQFEETIQKR